MAIYHFSMQNISRGKGRNAVAAASYRAGEKIKDEQTGKVNDYRKKQVDEKFILAPGNAPDWVHDRSKLWNEVERKENRKNSRLAKEINVALPIEIDKDLQVEMLKDYVKQNFVSAGMVADVCVHRDNEKNPHAHIMLTTREMDKDGFTKKNRNWDKKETLSKWRENWANTVNNYLEIEGVKERIDHRSYKEQGVDKTPTKHEGHKVTALKRKGIKTDRSIENEKIKEENAIREIQKTQEQIATTTEPKTSPILEDKGKSIPKPIKQNKNVKTSNFNAKKGVSLSELHQEQKKYNKIETEYKNLRSKEHKILDVLNRPNQLDKEFAELMIQKNELTPTLIQRTVEIITRDKTRVNKLNHVLESMEKIKDDKRHLMEIRPEKTKELKQVQKQLKEITPKYKSEKERIKNLQSNYEKSISKSKFLSKSKSKFKSNKMDREL